MQAQDVHSLYKDLLTPSDSQIVCMVIDGLGGLSHPDYQYKTELEFAQIPNLDILAQEGSCGAHVPVRSGITPGSVDAHVGVFGFDPLEVSIGRGAVEAAGVGFDLGSDDVATRCNWVTLDDEGKIIDRRAQRKESAYYTPLIQRLQKEVIIPGVEIFIIQGAEHRFVTVFRRKGLGVEVSDTDPQLLHVAPLKAEGKDDASKTTADIVNEFTTQAQKLLKEESIANGFTVRGYSHKPHIPSFQEAYGLKSVGIATHPLYKGIAKLFGMDMADVKGKEPTDILTSLKEVWGKYDFYYLHFKWPDSRGEDGDFLQKVAQLEQIDKIIPDIRSLNPDIMVVTGDHSTPAYMVKHSWHPVPTLIWGKNAMRDGVMAFHEKECAPQALNTVNTYAKDMIMPQVLAMSGRFKKYGP